MRTYKKNPDTDTVFFKDIAFNRYPNSKIASHRNYYRPHAGHIRKGIGHLHQEIWKDTYGAIPEGYEIHHIDGNPLNNDISNLECVTHLKHREKHKELNPELSNRLKEHAEKIRPLAKEWHNSVAGREWHSKHSKEIWKSRKPINEICACCGITFETLCYSMSKASKNRFCSQRCYDRYRALTKSRLKAKICPCCGKEFMGASRVKTCSRECGARRRWDTVGRRKS